MTRGARQAVVVLFALMVAVGVVNLLFTVHYVHATQAAAARQAAAEQAAQRREGAVVEQKLCTTLAALAALAPPPGPALANPSRGYEQDLARTLAQLGPDIGCRKTP